jgi:hypothetical protein
MQLTNDTSSKKTIGRSFKKILSAHDKLLKNDPERFSSEFILLLSDCGSPKPKYITGEPHSKPNYNLNVNGNKIKLYWSKPENIERIRKKTIERYKNPEARLKTSLGNIKRYSRPEEREKSRVYAIGRLHRPAAREKLVEVAIGGFWYGNVRYYNGPQYCELWNHDLKERVRAFFGYKCVECGQPQNGRALHVHHVWYNKKACCDDTPRSLVPLCHECHSKTSGNNKNHRKYWSDHFQDIIDNYYGGKCYLTKDEMQAYNGLNGGI